MFSWSPVALPRDEWYVPIHRGMGGEGMRWAWWNWQWRRWWWRRGNVSIIWIRRKRRDLWSALCWRLWSWGTRTFQVQCQLLNLPLSSICPLKRLTIGTRILHVESAEIRVYGFVYDRLLFFKKACNTPPSTVYILVTFFAGNSYYQCVLVQQERNTLLRCRSCPADMTDTSPV